ncbi:uncharacterized protein VTP21DRAFT_8340 [Calcarisporiella thermophila]|uniref:uncharacterized protein n=1 Tax=Calcarisporiella thermophila TaxID=911321 RepID=UPI003743D84B
MSAKRRAKSASSSSSSSSRSQPRLTESAFKSTAKRKHEVKKSIVQSAPRVSKKPQAGEEAIPYVSSSDGEDDAKEFYRKAQERMEIHQEGLSNTDRLLRSFDLDSTYGPCLGLTRLERWERAKKYGLAPPDKIRRVLLRKEKAKDEEALLCVLHDQIV